MKTTERHTRVPSPGYTHGHTHTAARAIADSDIEQGLFADGEDKLAFYFCSHHKFKQYANVCFFSRSRLRQCNEAKKYCTLNCVKIIKKVIL